MANKTRKRQPPRKEYRHLEKRQKVFDCLLCYRENEVAIAVRGLDADIRCNSCGFHCKVELPGDCASEVDAYHVWADEVEEKERREARLRMALVRSRGFDTSGLLEESFMTNCTRNRRPD